MTHGPLPTVSVRRAIMHMRWEQLTFIHWPYAPDVVQAVLPPGFDVDTFDGQAWVSLVPFVMRVTAPPRRGRPGQSLPFIGRFPETNVRTSVRRRAGRPLRRCGDGPGRAASPAPSQLSVVTTSTTG
jgi:uncharacterized protein